MTASTWSPAWRLCVVSRFVSSRESGSETGIVSRQQQEGGRDWFDTGQLLRGRAGRWTPSEESVPLTLTCLSSCKQRVSFRSMNRLSDLFLVVSAQLCLVLSVVADIVFSQSAEPAQSAITCLQSSQHAPCGDQLHSSAATSNSGLPPLLSHKWPAR